MLFTIVNVARFAKIHPDSALNGSIKKFEDRTGCAVIVNTSFNIRGEPIVCTPEDAYRCFMFSDMDVLVLENCLCLKDRQPFMEGAEEHKKKFKLD